MAVFTEHVLVERSHDTLEVLSPQVFWWLIAAPGHLQMHVQLQTISGTRCTLSTSGCKVRKFCKQLYKLKCPIRNGTLGSLPPSGPCPPRAEVRCLVAFKVIVISAMLKVKRHPGSHTSLFLHEMSLIIVETKLLW